MSHPLKLTCYRQYYTNFNLETLSESLELLQSIGSKNKNEENKLFNMLSDISKEIKINFNYSENEILVFHLHCVHAFMILMKVKEHEFRRFSTKWNEKIIIEKYINSWVFVTCNIIQNSTQYKKLNDILDQYLTDIEIKNYLESRYKTKAHLIQDIMALSNSVPLLLRFDDVTLDMENLNCRYNGTKKVALKYIAHCEKKASTTKNFAALRIGDFHDIRKHNIIVGDTVRGFIQTRKLSKKYDIKHLLHSLGLLCELQ